MLVESSFLYHLTLMFLSDQPFLHLQEKCFVHNHSIWTQFSCNTERRQLFSDLIYRMLFLFECRFRDFFAFIDFDIWIVSWKVYDRQRYYANNVLNDVFLNSFMNIFFEKKSFKHINSHNKFWNSLIKNVFDSINYDV